ncbi:MAG: ATP-binding protein [Gracilibacteraceae bacterium]|jgi:predicted AAA+ superfamily ATPase|nr:ATP-binding protein [Gracilibacteraceae bacterium]
MNRIEETRCGCKMLAMACHGLSVFAALLEDDAVRGMLNLLTAIGGDEDEDGLWDEGIIGSRETIFDIYHGFYRLIADKAWDDHVLDLMLMANNRLAALAAAEKPGLAERVREDAARDLQVLQELARLDGEKILLFVMACFENDEWEGDALFENFLAPRHWPVWRVSAENADVAAVPAEAPAQEWLRARGEELKTLFRRSRDWSGLVDALLTYYREVGCGVFANFAVFRLLEDGALEGVERPDPITVERLYCQEREQSVVLRNTEIFLLGLAASNIILYGSRGTGKSSLVKALPNAYVGRGLRLIQLKKTEIQHFTRLVRALAALPHKFILYIDDLSFDETEQDYKDMKMLLEGGVEARPANVLVYATSNRKNLIRETFSERRGDEVHARDSMEEKLSLADRFGITVTFLAPDQEDFLSIVSRLAERAGLDLPAAELRRKALLWTQNHNARSGRSAQQFIDNLRGELALKGAGIL